MSLTAINNIAKLEDEGSRIDIKDEIEIDELPFDSTSFDSTPLDKIIGQEPQNFSGEVDPLQLEYKNSQAPEDCQQVNLIIFQWVVSHIRALGLHSTVFLTESRFFY